MLKRFFTSFLGALSALWATIIILLFAGLVSFAIIGGSMLSSGSASVAVSDGSVILLELDGVIDEYPANKSLMATLQGYESQSTALSDIIRAIDSAADDSRIDGMLINCNGSAAGLAQRQAIMQAISRFRASGKWVYSYADQYSQGDYLVATAADSILINPSGIVDFHGLASQGLYFKGLLDKLGIQVQVFKVGSFKSAVEPFIASGPSPEAQLQQRVFLDNMWKVVIDSVASRRHVKPAAVNAWADSIAMAKPVSFYLANKLVDASLYYHEALDRVAARAGVDDTDNLSLVPLTAYMLDAKAKSRKHKGANLAVYYAVGDIVDSGETGIVGPKVTEDIIRLAKDDDYDGLVLRVNSGGGSAFASEQIWEALKTWKKLTGKPFYVSMSDYAASGGYYISCGADKIYAQSLTLTGSIGIFGLMPNAERLLSDKLGVTSAMTATNPRAVPQIPFKPMTPEQAAAMQQYVERGYQLFMSRVAAGRKMSVDSVNAIAQGRVWDGGQALRIGLVDKIGGLEDALADMARELGEESYSISTFPKTEPNLLAILAGQYGSMMELSQYADPRAMAEAIGLWNFLTASKPLRAWTPTLVIE